MLCWDLRALKTGKKFLRVHWYLFFGTGAVLPWLLVNMCLNCVDFVYKIFDQCYRVGCSPCLLFDTCRAIIETVCVEGGWSSMSGKVLYIYFILYFRYMKQRSLFVSVAFDFHLIQMLSKNCVFVINQDRGAYMLLVYADFMLLTTKNCSIYKWTAPRMSPDICKRTKDVQHGKILHHKGLGWNMLGRDPRRRYGFLQVGAVFIIRKMFFVSYFRFKCRRGNVPGELEWTICWKTTLLLSVWGRTGYRSSWNKFLRSRLHYNHVGQLYPLVGRIH